MHALPEASSAVLGLLLPRVTQRIAAERGICETTGAKINNATGTMATGSSCGRKSPEPRRGTCTIHAMNIKNVACKVLGP